MRRVALAVLSLAPLSGCALRSLAVRGTADLLEAGAPAFHRESDLELARQSLPAQLKLMEALLESAPRDARLLGALAEGFCGYAFLFLEDEAPARAAGFYRRCADYGLRAASARNRALQGLSGMPPARAEAALGRARAADVPALYWAATGWAGWANAAKDEPEAVAGLPKAARVMERVRALDPAYQFGGPDLFLGVYYAARPRLAGGDLAKAKAHFEAALAAGRRRFLTAQLLYAQYWAVAASAEADFRRLNEEILKAPADALPEARLANEAAKRKARRLLEKTDELF